MEVWPIEFLPSHYDPVFSNDGNSTPQISELSLMGRTNTRSPNLKHLPSHGFLNPRTIRTGDTKSVTSVIMTTSPLDFSISDMRKELHAYE